MISKRWILFLGAAFLAIATPGRAQKTANLRVYKAADGLPESYASSVTIGNRGDVWIKHLNAPLVSCLDGYGIRTIPSPGIGANRFYESPGGQVWTVAREGLQQFADDHWIQYSIPEISAAFRKNALSLFRPVPLCPIRQNRLLFVIPEGLMEFNVETPDHPQTVMLLSANHTHLQKFSSLTAARDGGLWISAARGLAKVSGPLRNLKSEPEWQEFLIGADQSFQNLREPVEDDAGGITALADSRAGGSLVLAHLDGKKWSEPVSHLGKITSAWPGMGGTYWAMTSRSLFHVKEGGAELSGNDEISAQHNFDFALEPNGIFWLATSDGLFRHSPFTWRSPPGREMPTSVIYAILEDSESRFWFASAGFVYRFQNQQWKSYPYESDDTGDAQAPRSLFLLPDGTIALSLGERLLQFNSASERFEQIMEPGGRRLKFLGQLKDGRLAAQILTAETDGPHYRLELYDGKKFSPFPYDLPDVNLGNELSLLFATQNGNIWLCGSKGMGWYHDKKWQISGPPGMSVQEPTTCITEVSEGRVWFGIQDKIWEFDGKTWHLMQGGVDQINNILKARDGSVWVASDNGVHRHYQGAWAVNTLEEGLPAVAVREVYEDSAGRIWAGTMHGVSLYHPEADPDPPRTYVQDLPDSRSTLQEGTMVNITFSAQDKWKYTSKDRLLFSYRLDQKEWSAYQEEKSVYFPDLPPGKHYFQVRSMDRNWNVDPKPAILEFVIALPWYKESRLLMIGSAGLALAVFFAGVAFNRHRRLVHSYAEVEAKIALRTTQLELANRELFHSQKMNALGTLAAGIAHDFNNILSIIKGSAQIIEDNPGNSEKIATRTDRIKTVVAQGTGIVNAMLGFSRTSDKQLVLGDVNTIVEETVKLLGDRFRRDVTVQTHLARKLPKITASKEFIQQILLNLVFNASEATTENRHIVLTTRVAQQLPPSLVLNPANATEYVTISVKDFGCGIAPEIMPRIFEPFFTTKALSARRGTGLGLSMVYELAKQMNAGLAVESFLGQGSTFTLIFPAKDLPMDSPGETK